MKMRLDPNDIVDQLHIQELKGKPVSFVQWKYVKAMVEKEEASCVESPEEEEEDDSWREKLLPEAEAFRADFRTRLAAHGLPADDRFELCRLLSERAQAEPSWELLQIYSELLGGLGYLLSDPPELNEQYGQEDWEELLILMYLYFLPERDEPFQILRQRVELAGRFAEVKKIKRSPEPVDCVTERRHEILQCFLSRIELPAMGSKSKLLDNLEHFIQVAAANPVLRSVEPLFLFLLLTRRKGRMCKGSDPSIDFAALWKRDERSIAKNNGRNYKDLRAYLQFFAELCRLYEKDKDVDLPLCWYGLEQITVLGDFYWQEVFDILDDSTELPFLPTVEDLVEESWFSCFDCEPDDNLLQADNGLLDEEIAYFQCSEDPRISAALDRIADYMNDHAAELTEQFLTAGPQRSVRCAGASWRTQN